MLGTVLLMTCLGAAAVAAAPPAVNLAVNPSFEEGMRGWEKAWARREGTATATIEKGSGRNGSACLKVEHYGGEDWAVGQARLLISSPGQVYEVSAWFRTPGPGGEVEASCAVRDAAGEAIDWAAGSARPSGTGPDDRGFRRAVARFVAPARTATVQLRIIGRGPGTVWCDDVSLAKLEAPVARRFADVVLKNRSLSVAIDGMNGTLTVSGTGAGRAWSQVPPSASLALTGLKRLSATGAVITASDALSGAGLKVSVSLHPSLPRVTVEVDGGKKPLAASHLFYPPAFSSTPGDFALLPFAEGLILPVTDPGLKRWFELSEWKSAMGFAGVTDMERGYIVIADPPHDAGFSLEPEGGLLAIRPFMKPSRGSFGYPRRFTYAFSAQGGVTALAMLYRSHAKGKGWVVPLASRRKANPNIGKLMGAVDLWALDRNLPEGFYDDLKACGVDKALVSLDGGWLGPDKAAATIRKLNAMGWLTSRYDIYTDVWNKADKPSKWLRTDGYPEDVTVMADGSLRKGWVDKGEGGPYQGYYTCSLTHYAAAKKRISADLKGNPYNARFIDVVTASGLAECWSKTHPTDRAGDAAARARMLSLVSRELKLVTGSEEIRDWAVPFSEFSEGTMSERPHSNAGYDWGKPVEVEPEYAKFNSSAIYRAPLFELVFHDCHVSTWYTGDGASKVPDAWEAKDLLNILYGTMPLWMPNAELWSKYRERFIASYHNVCTVFGVVAGSAMVSWEPLSPDRAVQRTRFASGTTVTANFGEVAYRDPEGYVLPRNGYMASGKEVGAWRMTWMGRTVNRVETRTRVFLDPGGALFEEGQLTSDGPVLLLKEGKGARIVLLGRATTIGIAPGILTARVLETALVTPLDRAGRRLAPVPVARTGGRLIFSPVEGSAIYEVR